MSSVASTASGGSRCSSDSEEILDEQHNGIEQPMNISSSAQTMNRPRTGLLVLMRHGQSMWNRKPKEPKRLWRYAGSFDVPLSETGVLEALEAGKRLRNVPVDYVFTSKLARATTTALLALNNHSSGKTPVIGSRNGFLREALEVVGQLPEDNKTIPVVCTSALNERNFGDLQGMSSKEHLVRYNREYLHHVRNDFDTPFPGEYGESSHDVAKRVVAYFKKHILPLLEEGKNITVVSHGFVMRTLIMYLDNMTKEEWNEQMHIEKSKPAECKLLAATGVPMLYQYVGKDTAKDVVSSILFGNEDTVHSCFEKLEGDKQYELEQTCAPY